MLKLHHLVHKSTNNQRRYNNKDNVTGIINACANIIGSMLPTLLEVTDLFFKQKKKTKKNYSKQKVNNKVIILLLT